LSKRLGEIAAAGSAALVLMLTVLPAHGQDMTTAQRKACAADYKKLCPGVRPGEGRIIACFEDHLPELSPGCKATIKEKISEKRSHG
jgi:hypothetical protein